MVKDIDSKKNTPNLVKGRGIFVFIFKNHVKKYKYMIL